jgi:predicted MFS family arabinose efflux permease
MGYLGMYTFQSYLFPYLLVDSNLSVAAATNVLVIQPFCSTFGVMGSGFILKYLGRPKWIIVAGFCVNTLGMGLTLGYRDASVRIAPLLVGQGLFGLGQGIVYTIQTAMQASVGEPCKLLHQVRILSFISRSLSRNS